MNGEIVKVEQSGAALIMSAEIGELAKALAAAQGEFTAVKKTATNPFFKSKYAPLEEVTAATQPALTKHGLAVTQLTSSNGKIELVTLIIHSSGQYIGSTYPVNPTKNDPQGMGSAMTYARRYSLMAVLGVPAEDDDGQAGSTTVKTPLPKPSDAPKQEEKKEEEQKKEQEFAKDKPAPAAKQEKPDDEVLAGCESKVTVIERYMLKEGLTKGKTWHRHACLAEKEWYSTFSDTVGELMKALEAQNAMLYYKVQTTTAGTNNQLIWIEAVE